MEPSRVRPLLLSLGLAASVAAGVAGIATFLGWRVNPSGLFRGPGGTHWPVVWDTFASWFFPVLLGSAVIALVASTLYARWAGARGRRVF